MRKLFGTPSPPDNNCSGPTANGPPTTPPHASASPMSRRTPPTAAQNTAAPQPWARAALPLHGRTEDFAAAVPLPVSHAATAHQEQQPTTATPVHEYFTAAGAA